MKRFLLLIFLTLSLCTHAEKRALVIGIGKYPKETMRWDAINGDNDIDLVQAILLENGFTENDIITLRNEQATYYNIGIAFLQLIKQATQGDIVYIHFSGHGQQITDLNGDESDGWDECWIPYDAAIQANADYHGERHLTDDELNYYLFRLREKVGASGKITVVGDACHSGTGTRKGVKIGMRGTSSKFLLTDYSPDQLRQWGFSKYALSNQKPKAEQWLHISACADGECNRQCKGTLEENNAEEELYGSLTYALYLLRDKLSSAPAADLFPLLQTQVNKLVPRPQTPQLEGDKSFLQQPIL